MALPAHGPPLPVDPIADRLIALYTAAERKLDAQIASALNRGARGTARYYTNQQVKVTRILRELQVAAAPLKRALVPSAYGTGVAAVDRVLDRSAAFSGVHGPAMEVIAANLEDNLRYAEEKIGRNAADVFRQVGLQQAGVAIAAGSAPRDQARAIEAELRQNGMTAFVDRRGRRWSLSTYAAMVARTTTREANSVGMKNRLLEHGRDLVEISEHLHSCPICLRYQGKTFSLTGTSGNYPHLDKLPPFHPNCRHVLLPARVTFEEMEKALGLGPTPEVAKALDPQPDVAPELEVTSWHDRRKIGNVGLVPDKRVKFEEAADGLDRVLRVPPDMPQLHVDSNDPYGNIASGQFDAGDEAAGILPSIRFRSDAATPTVWHEMGHYLDRYGLGPDGRKRISLSPEAAELKNAIGGSHTYRQLFIPIERRKLGITDGYSDYLTRPEEVWARAFAQYVAKKNGRVDELRAYYTNRDGEVSPAFVWPDDEFEPIEKAFDDYFGKKGWLRQGDTEIGVTPFRGAGKALGEDYYATSRYKGFEAAIPDEAAIAGVDLKRIDRVRGVWAGGGEPSAKITVEGDPDHVRKLADALGSRYGQDAVISWKPDPEGPNRRFTSSRRLGLPDPAIERAIADANYGVGEDGRIEGATRTPDGHLEIVDLKGTKASAATISKLAKLLGISFDWEAGRGELRFRGDDYA